MRNTEKILGLTFLAGLIMKFAFIQGAGLVITVSILSIAIMYYFLGFALFNQIPLRAIFKKDSYKGKSTYRIIGAVGAGIGISMICNGILFKLQDWPFALSSLGWGLVLTSIILVIAIVKFFKTRSNYYILIFKRIAVIGILGLILYFTPAMSIVKFQFRNHPDYIKVYEQYANNPKDEMLRQKLGIEYRRAIMTQQEFENYMKEVGQEDITSQVLATGIKRDTTISIIIRDSSLYSIPFLKSLDPKKAHWKFYLDGDRFIINNSDTVLFPNVPPLNKVMFFTGSNGDLRINLFVKRILISTIDYKIEVIKKDNPPIIKSGLADLSPYFFLHSKLDEVDSTGYSYESNEYWDIKGSDLTSIRIGKAQDNNKLLLGKVECKLASIEITQDNCPILFGK